MAVKKKYKLSRKEQIINAARKLVIKYGSENVTVRKIAEEVGFSEAAIYRHFTSKKDILYGLVESIENNLLTDIEARGKPEYGRLENVLFNHLSAVEMRKGISFQVIAEIISLGDKKLNKRIYQAINSYIDKIKDILQEEVAKGTLRKDLDIDSAAMIVFSVVQGLSNIWTLSNYNFNPKDKFEPMLDLIHKGLT